MKLVFIFGIFLMSAASHSYAQACEDIFCDVSKIVVYVHNRNCEAKKEVPVELCYPNLQKTNVSSSLSAYNLAQSLKKSMESIYTAPSKFFPNGDNNWRRGQPVEILSTEEANGSHALRLKKNPDILFVEANLYELMATVPIVRVNVLVQRFKDGIGPFENRLFSCDLDPYVSEDSIQKSVAGCFRNIFNPIIVEIQ